jgi:hypothetical protein
VTLYHIVVAHAVKVVLLATLIGLYVRGRHRACWSFPVYLAVALVCNTLVSVWPETFYEYDFWQKKQAAYDILNLIIALELGARAFAHFPGALATARVVALFVLTASTIVVTSTAAGSFNPEAAHYDWLAGTSTASVWVFGAVALLVVWYRIPVDDMHRAILMGFVTYLALFTVGTGILKHYGWQAHPAFWKVETAAYLLLVSLWAVAAWHREEEAPALSPAVAERLGLATR